MKKVFIFLAIAVLTVSCSTEDENSEKVLAITEQTIVGTWKLKSRTIDGEPQELLYLKLVLASGNKATMYTNNGYNKDSGTYSITDKYLKCTFTDPQYKILGVNITSLTTQTLKCNKVMPAGLVEYVYTH